MLGIVYCRGKESNYYIEVLVTQAKRVIIYDKK